MGYVMSNRRRLLVVTFAVVLGAATLAAGLGDAAGGRGLFWFAMAALILLVVDVLLLVAVLGIQALAGPRDGDSEGP